MRGSCDEGNQIALSEGSAKNLISKSLIPQRKHFITHRFSGVATGQLPPAAHFWRAARSVGAALWVSNTSCIIRLLILNPRVLSQAIISARKCYVYIYIYIYIPSWAGEGGILRTHPQWNFCSLRHCIDFITLKI